MLFRISRNVLLVVALIALLTATDVVADSESTAPKPSITINPSKDASDLSEPIVGKVELARALLGARLVDSKQHLVGKVEDVAIDVTQAKVNAVYMSAAKSPTEPTQETTIVPYSTLKRADNKSDFVIVKLPAKSAATREEPTEKNQLILINKNKSIEVRDGDDQLLGHIVDFALIPGKDQVAYTIFTTKQKISELTKDQDYYPIPLSAYVVKNDPKVWLLDLPKDLLKNTPTYSLNKLPAELSTAWTEYVRVRYGRPVLDGVQNEAPVNKQKDK